MLTWVALLLCSGHAPAVVWADCLSLQASPSMVLLTAWGVAALLQIGGKCRLLSTGEARVKRLDKVLRAGLSEELRMGSIIRWTDSEFDNIMARKGKL
jgi:hypothetical protein